MKIEFIINSDVSCLLTPETDLEIEILKALGKQQNDLIELRGTLHVLSKTVRGGVLICKKDTFSNSDNNSEENKGDLKDQLKKYADEKR